MRKLFTWLRSKRFLRGLEPQAFAKGAAHFLSELNAIHPFRDGNGRTQLAFMALLAAQAGQEFNVQNIKRGPFLVAMRSRSTGGGWFECVGGGPNHRVSGSASSEYGWWSFSFRNSTD
jgi:fido (protein-threonine AMPylation protein)